jgi:hypothetical protein
MRVFERCRRDEAPPFEMRRCGVAQLSFRLLACPFCNPERQEGFEQFCESKRPRRAVRVRYLSRCVRSAFALGWLRGLRLRGGFLRSSFLHSFLASSVAINAYGESTVDAGEERGNCHGQVMHKRVPGPRASRYVAQSRVHPERGSQGRSRRKKSAGGCGFGAVGRRLDAQAREVVPLGSKVRDGNFGVEDVALDTLSRHRYCVSAHPVPSGAMSGNVAAVGLS